MKKAVLFFYSIVAFCSFCYCQNVGIGTSTPLEKLQVAGNLKADTIKPNAIKLTPNAAEGKVLISDNNGNGSWRANSALSGAGNIGYGVWGDCATNGNISEYQPLTDSTGAINAIYGNAVSVSGNYAIVGAPKDEVGAHIDQGSASIYKYNGSSWVLMQKINDPVHGVTGDFFGYSVSISDNYAIIGAPYVGFGSLYRVGTVTIYKFNGTSWVFMQTLAGTFDGDEFGTSVSQVGNFIICGAPGYDYNGASQQGGAFVYQYSVGSNWVLVGGFTNRLGAAGDHFGTSVSMSGDSFIVGAPDDDIEANVNQGSASIYKYNGSVWSWSQTISAGIAGDQFGESVSISGNYVIVSIPKANHSQGSASIYQYKNSSWMQEQVLSDISGESGDTFGSDVFISGNYAIVSAFSDDVGSNVNQGSATVYTNIGQVWQKLQYITDPQGMQTDVMGTSCAIDGITKRFVIGANGFNNFMGKVVFGKLN